MKVGSNATKLGMASPKFWQQARGPMGLLSVLAALLVSSAIAPQPFQAALAKLGLTILGLALAVQGVPLLALRESTRSFRLASRGQHPQALFFNILAQDKLRRQPWRGGLRLLRLPTQSPTLALALRAAGASSRLAMGQFQDAERGLRSVVRECPDHAVAWHNLALALYAQGKHRQAKKALEQAVGRGLVVTSLQLRLAPWPGRGPKRGLCNADFYIPFYQEFGFHDIALNYLRFWDKPEVCWRKVLSLLALGRCAEAERLAWSEIGRQPNNSYAWLSYGFLQAQHGRWALATMAYRKALALEPGNLACKEQFFLLRARTGDSRCLQDSLAVLAEYELDPGHEALGKAFLLFGLRRWSAALAQVIKAGPAARNQSCIELVAYASLRLGQHRVGFRSTDASSPRAVGPGQSHSAASSRSIRPSHLDPGHSPALKAARPGLNLVVNSPSEAPRASQDRQTSRRRFSRS